MKSEDVIYYGSCVRASNNNARSWMLRDQLNKYRRNLSEMAKSITRHIKNNSPRISLHHASPIPGKIQIMFNDGGRAEVPSAARLLTELPEGSAPQSRPTEIGAPRLRCYGDAAISLATSFHQFCSDNLTENRSVVL